MEQIVYIGLAIIGMMLYVVNTSVQNTKRTANKWIQELLDTGKIVSSETSELGTIYSSPVANWFLNISHNNKIYVLRNHKIRGKIREYKKYKTLRDVLTIVFVTLAGSSFYILIN